MESLQVYHLHSCKCLAWMWLWCLCLDLRFQNLGLIDEILDNQTVNGVFYLVLKVVTGTCGLACGFTWFSYL